MKCDEARRAMPLFLYGELSFDEEDGFETHIDECADCRVEMEREKRFHHALNEAPLDVPLELVHQSRHELHARLAGGDLRPTLWDHFRDLFTIRVHIPAAVQPFGALALIAMGFFGARFVPQTGGPVSMAGLANPVASRVRYVEPGPAGRVQIVVEETRQRTLSGTVGDQHIQQLLISAAQDPADPGLRVESMDLLKSRPDALEVRNALLSALQHDPNAGVRLKALDGLKGSAGEPEVRQALLKVLLSDKNPGVRTQVIDLLIQPRKAPESREEPAMAGVLQELMRTENNGYVRMRCQKALRDMGASVETF